jgi:hypothetical protein
VILTLPVFSHDTVIVDSWDKNGVYYNLHKGYFPNVSSIIMMSHPCQYGVTTRFSKTKDKEAATWILQNGGHRYFNNNENSVIPDIKQEKELASLIQNFPAYTTDNSMTLLKIDDRWYDFFNFLQK